MSKVFDYYNERHEIEEEEPYMEIKLCDGDCGNSYNVGDLYKADMGFTKYVFCKRCMFEFVATQDIPVYYEKINA